MPGSRARISLSKAASILQEYPHSFKVLIAGTFIDRLGTNLIIPFLAIYVAQRFNVATTQIGVIFTIFALSGAVGNVLAGALADRFGRRTLMIIGLVCAATARVMMGVVFSIEGLYLFAVFAGFFGAVSGPAQTAMVADILPPEKRADGFGIQRVVNNVTWILGPLLGAILGQAMGYLSLFILDALTSYIMAYITYRFLAETNPVQPSSEKGKSIGATFGGYRQVASNGYFMGFVLISTLMMFAYIQMYAPLSIYIVQVQHYPTSFYSVLLMLNALLVVVLQFPFTRWSSKQPPMLIRIAATAMYLVGLTAYGLGNSTALYIVAMGFITFGEMLSMPTGQALATDLAPENMRARYIAVFSLFNWTIPQAFGPLLSGVIMDRFDARWVWYGSGILCAISLVGFYVLHARSTGQHILPLSSQQEAAKAVDS